MKECTKKGILENNFGLNSEQIRDLKVRMTKKYDISFSELIDKF